MGYDLEGGRSTEVTTPTETDVETGVGSEHISETEQTEENFDDCALSSEKNEINSASVEDTKDDFDDCEANPENINDGKSSPKEYEADNFDDCAKESARDLSEEANRHNEIKEPDLSVRVESALEKEDITKEEVKELSDENSKMLDEALSERNKLEQELKQKFDETSSKEFGTEEYKASLSEYNALLEQKAALDEKVDFLSGQQDSLNQKSLDLREAQIAKGEEAVAASSLSLATFSELSDRFDNTFYTRNPDHNELNKLCEENSRAIKELSDEKAAIKQAMDAKMDEISEYVRSNNMGIYDTQNDPHYQNLTAQYLAMQSAEDKISYSIVKLDDNNLRICETTGREYTSALDTPPESEIASVNDGTDVPGETDYFVDEARAAEVLGDFKQEQWEKLSLDEQKQAIEKLADYNADILGVEDKPRIIYYHKEDPSDFGGFSEEQNAIYINEYNMKDAAETADTISHEYRHKYQHARAEKLENERDLQYRDGFDNYINSKDDYEGYKNQFVEVEAREYASVFKDKINSLPPSDGDNSHYAPNSG